MKHAAVFLTTAIVVAMFVDPAKPSGSDAYPCFGNACDRPGHDPSAMQRTKTGNIWVTLVTGSGAGEAFGMKYLDPSKKALGWRQGPDSFLVPDWIEDYLYPSGCSDEKGIACPFWAPDLPSNGNGVPAGGDHFIMYYSVAVPNIYGRACIGRAEGHFSLQQSGLPNIEWKDSGMPIVCSNESQVASGGPHAIDPSVSIDAQGKWWLTYGSFSDASVGSNGGGVWMVELNASSGMLGSRARSSCPGVFGAKSYPTPFCWKPETAAFSNVANNRCVAGSGRCDSKYDNTNSLEASYLYNFRGGRHAEHYYLFINYFWCCREGDSTYEIRVGRSSSPSGPFVDKEGLSMDDGGGTLLLRNVTVGSQDRSFVGPGHAGIAYDDSQGIYVFTFDFQGIVDGDGGLEAEYATQARVLSWDANGWPVISRELWIPKA